MNKPQRILNKLNDKLVEQEIIFDGKLIYSRKGVPYLWLDHNEINISVCYFLTKKCLKIWTGVGTDKNKYIKTVKDFNLCIPAIKEILSEGSSVR